MLTNLPTGQTHYHVKSSATLMRRIAQRSNATLVYTQLPQLRLSLQVSRLWRLASDQQEMASRVS